MQRDRMKPIAPEMENFAVAAARTVKPFLLLAAIDVSVFSLMETACDILVVGAAEKQRHRRRSVAVVDPSNPSLPAVKIGRGDVSMCVGFETTADFLLLGGAALHSSPPRPLLRWRPEAVTVRAAASASLQFVPLQPSIFHYPSPARRPAAVTHSRSMLPCSNLRTGQPSSQPSLFVIGEKAFAIIIGLLAGVVLLIIFLAFLRRIYEGQGSEKAFFHLRSASASVLIGDDPVILVLN
ncbi:hypothetical protein PIB30_078171 [Stylosanthes scabra]|uniref:Uncharacterized protein n=1 Tax=Stylosanthes scabra TaxID=79078 RepID=A0ABU6TS51_9FABA|nr:hypothetical protein [Stylosanthes scabra]